MNRRHTLIAVGIVAVLLAFGAVLVSTRGSTQKPDVVVVAGTTPATPGAPNAGRGRTRRRSFGSRASTRPASHISEAPKAQRRTGRRSGTARTRPSRFSHPWTQRLRRPRRRASS